MTRLVLTDALIREALGPDPHTTAPAGLLAQITADVARTPQHRTLRFPALPQSRRFAWVLVGAATLLLLLGALLVAGGSPSPFEAVLPPARSALPQQLPVMMDPITVEIEAISAEEAWASVGTGELWHRTVAGWTGPFDPLDTPRDDQVRDLARMPDGRLVVSADRGIWVGDESGWTRVSQGGPWGVSADSNGVIWAGRSSGGRGLSAYRERDETWDAASHACSAGGNLVATATDGSVWTAGIGYLNGNGLARLIDGSCQEFDPWGDRRRHDVMGIATGGTGRVAIMARELGDGPTASRIMTWDGQGWRTLRAGMDVSDSGFSGLAYGPDGTLWTAFDGRLWRYVNGVEFGRSRQCRRGTGVGRPGRLRLVRGRGSRDRGVIRGPAGAGGRPEWSDAGAHGLAPD